MNVLYALLFRHYLLSIDFCSCDYERAGRTYIQQQLLDIRRLLLMRTDQIVDGLVEQYKQASPIK